MAVGSNDGIETGDSLCHIRVDVLIHLNTLGIFGEANVCQGNDDIIRGTELSWKVPAP